MRRRTCGTAMMTMTSGNEEGDNAWGSNKEDNDLLLSSLFGYCCCQCYSAEMVSVLFLSWMLLMLALLMMQLLLLL